LVVTDGSGIVTWDKPVTPVRAEVVDEIAMERLLLLLVQVKVVPVGGVPKLTYWH
jgi:hypothetical protein